MEFFNKKQNQTDTLLQERAIVEAIHREFDEAGEKLLQEALAIINKGTDDVNKAMRLKKLGFTSAEIVIKTEAQQKLIEISEKEAELVQYYQQTYPFLKFLKEDQLDAICKKYNLIYAPVANYIGDVPEKNLREIELAQPLKKEDEIKPLSFWESEAGIELSVFLYSGIVGASLITKQTNEKIARKENISALKPTEKLQPQRTFKDKRGLFIAAPQSHFNLEGLKNEGLGFFKEVKDPIVFRYVRGGIQVLSKWGLEAYDEALINPISN